MNINKIFTEGAVKVDKSEATEEAECGAVLPSLYAKEYDEPKYEQPPPGLINVGCDGSILLAGLFTLSIYLIIIMLVIYY